MEIQHPKFEKSLHTANILLSPDNKVASNSEWSENISSSQETMNKLSKPGIYEYVIVFSILSHCLQVWVIVMKPYGTLTDICLTRSKIQYRISTCLSKPENLRLIP